MILSPASFRRARAADQLVDLLDDAVIMTDRAQMIVRFNRGAEKLFGWRADEVLGQPLDILLPERFHALHGAQMDEFAQGPLASRAMSMRNRQTIALCKDGEECVVTVQILRLGRGRQMQMAAVVRAVSAVAHSVDEALRLAAVDPLTGAYNQREVSAIAAREGLRAARYHHPLSVLLLDLDGFRAINENHGASRGDTIVQTFADMCAHTLRSVDVLGRWNDNAFVILLPETATQSALTIAERLRRQTEALTFGAPAIGVTVSIGISQYRDSETALDGPLARAQAALDDAKRQGRNRIAVSRA